MTVYMRQVNDMMEYLPESEQQLIVEFIKRISDGQRAVRNAEYLAMLDESAEQIENGEVISFTMEELKAFIESDED